MTDGANGVRVAPPAALVVFGATGDLAHRKLYPALAQLKANGQLSEQLALVGVARTEMTDADFAASIPDLDGRVPMRYVPGSYDDPVTFRRLAEVLEQCDARVGTEGNRLYYLAIVPSGFDKCVAGLGESGLAGEPEGCFRRLVIEKPFGRDLPSAVALDECLHAVFREHQVFRIDHYLAKETVQNILALRFATTSTTSSSRSRSRSEWSTAARSTSRRARCATSCRTTSCRCSRSPPWSRPRASRRMRSVTRR
jgi:glucose-6-phosphate 1-dehydrogenase